MDRVAKRLQAAHTAAREADNAVAQLSTARLTEIKGIPAKTAAQHLDDPSLTAEDRALLRQWLRQQLPQRRSKRRRISGLPQVFGWMLRFPRLILLALGLLVCTGLAWSNTPATIGTGQTMHALDITWTGSFQPQRLPAGTTLGVVGSTSTEWQVRVWEPSTGYAVVGLGGNDILVQLNDVHEHGQIGRAAP